MVLRLLRVGQRVSFYCTLMVRSKHVASSELQATGGNGACIVGVGVVVVTVVVVSK